MREYVQPESSGAVQLDFYVKVTDHIGLGASGSVLPVAYASVHYDPVVEHLRRDRHIKHIVAPFIRLVFQSQIDRYVKFLQNIVQLVGHYLRHI